jgi:ABC-type nitrate/sulfonate/bicarbonate transport system substrate-binding protein
MKRFFLVVLCFILMFSTLAGCKKSIPTVRIASVTNTAGAPLAHILEKTKNGFAYSSKPVNLPNRARQAIADGECDIAIVPIDTASALYKRAEPEIKILAGVSVGGFELVATEELASLENLKGGSVYISARDTLMGDVFSYLLEQYKLYMPNDVSFNYADSLTAIQSAFKNNKAKFALLTSAEAALIKTNISGLKSYNITDELAKKFNKPSIINYCIIATTNFINKNPEMLKETLKDIESAFSKNTKTADTITLAKKHGLITDDAYGEEFLNSCKIDYISGEAMKTKFNAYFKTLRKIKPSVASKMIDKDDLFYITKK